MSIRPVSTRMGMFVLLLLALMPNSGCSQRHILRMSNPELSTTVSLHEVGSDEGDADDTTIVIDEPQRIAKVAAFFQARSDKWVPMDEEFRRKPRSAIAFRKGDQTKDRFWLERDRLCLQQPSGEYFVCDLSDAERAELVGLFHFTTNFKSDQ
jgi:hypothetical protein